MAPCPKDSNAVEAKDEYTLLSDKEERKPASKNERWLRRLQEWLKRRDPKSASAVTLLLFVIYWWHRKGGSKRLLLAVTTAWRGPEYQRGEETPLSSLWKLAQEGLVQKALVGSSSIVFQTRHGWKKANLPPDSPTLKSDLMETLSRGGCDDVGALPDSLPARIVTPVLTALPFVYLALLYRMMKNMYGTEDVASKIYKGDADRTTFADVAGLDHVITEVAEVVDYLADPAIYHGLGARPPRGILLSGPPGTGKTLLARAIAGEAHCDTFIACSGSDFVEMFVGRGAARIRSLFDKARQSARSKHRNSYWWQTFFPRPNRTAAAILFIDEFDCLAKTRSMGGITGNDERDQTLNQLLTAMDGFEKEEDVTVIVIAASNRADILDPAILRRFDRQIHVGYPNVDGRKAILLVHARRIQCSRQDIDWDQLASEELTSKFSGADLRNLVNEAALLAVRDRSSSVEHRHMLQAARRVRDMKRQFRSQPANVPFVLRR